jgi:Cys-rich repeat protein
MTQRKYPAISAATALCLVLAAAAPAAAQSTTVACDDATTLPNPVYLAGSSAIEPTLAQLAVQVTAKQGMTLIYNPISSCSGAADIVDSTQVLSGTAHYYVADATQASGVATKSCTIATGTRPLIGISDVFYESCTGASLPATVGEWHGPVQPMLLIVPEANVTTTALSYQQAAAIWGCGAKGLQSPFIDETAIQQRTSTSGTQTMVAAAIGVPPTAFKGKQNSGGSGLVTSLLAVADPQTAIGILAADAYDPARATLNSVAFQGKGQTKAYYADSDANSVDKKNVRDGHYVIQGPVHIFSQLVNGAPSATAKKVLDWITGVTPIDATDANNTGYIKTVALAGNVPQCAMKVSNAYDGGPFSVYTPPVSCGCFYEKTVSKLTTDPVGCVPCTADSQCTGGKRCQTGYCE